ncbi:hypothetical protein SAMD00023353_2000820 [Rosellinia necatrix]|uniref:Uncharacterized protein n=1 Tax=Rosellinia necatrix TaxID=77044 RepID=A0A1S8A7I9_ROSNE|nr:hypothetical protein SAMD00023353_2000820 [Rosellinia necatrix]
MCENIASSKFRILQERSHRGSSCQSSSSRELGGTIPTVSNSKYKLAKSMS